MEILKKHNGIYLVFNTDSTDIIRLIPTYPKPNLEEGFIPLFASKEIYNSEKEYLDKYFDENHIIFNNFDESDYYYMLIR